MRIFTCILVRTIWRFTACCWLWLFCVQGANALDYYWYPSGSNLKYSSPSAACAAVASGADKVIPSNLIVSGHSLTAVSAARFDCVLTVEEYPGSGFRKTSVPVFRVGDACPSGTEYDAATGECKVPPKNCSSEKGSILARGSIGSIVKSANGSRWVMSDPPSTACVDSCEYEGYSRRSTSCYAVRGSTTQGFCNFLIQGTGNSCSGWSWNPPEVGDQLNAPPAAPDPSAPPPSDPNDPGCPSGWSWSGTTCVKSPGQGEGGDSGGNNSGGGSGNGSGNGSGGNSGGNSGGSGGGSGGNSGGSGNGSGGNSGGSGNGSGGGTGSGDDGNIKCDPATDPNKCGQSSVAGEGCGEALSCSGDAIQCAILRQQRAQRCADDEFRRIDEKKIQDLKNTLASEFSGPEFSPIKPTAETTYDLTRVIDTSSRFSKSCPIIPDIAIPWFGSTHVVPMSVIASQLCEALRWLGYLVVAFAMRSAAEIIARGLN